ncbi:MAG: trigger factor [[Eubacterium] sulci]|nr:trigger factor [[Eubacterium] sulci]MBF1157393.1 trigger factor [[Eubacterium] sulci]MBF1168582.1 trigger factor [[Eubacterium] sulci]MBF1173886.1 trigger factor [[Eubacterium] sulci]MBF1176847.1 trigger factor [[Eubacterium] sulci]
MNKKLLIGSGVVVAIVAVIAIILVFVNNKQSKEYNYDLSKYVKVGNYKGLEYASQKASVTDEEVDAEIQRRLQKAAKTENSKTGKVENGDTINISFVGKIDGKEFEGGSSESTDITVGTTQMIDGFVEGLIGKNVGESVTLNLKFPDDYGKTDLQGKAVEFKVTINSKKKISVPKLNTEFVKKNSKYKTVKEYKEGVKKELLNQKQKSIDSTVKQELWSRIINKSKAKKYPEKELNEAMSQANKLEESYKAQAQNYGMEWETYLKTVMRTDKKGFEKLKQEYAKNIVFNRMVMYSIARSENISLSNREYKKEILKILEDNGYDEESFKKAFGKDIETYADEQNWRQKILFDKVLDKVMKDGKKVSQKEYQKIVAEEQAKNAKTSEK